MRMRRTDFIHILIGSATLIPAILGVLLYAPRVAAPPAHLPEDILAAPVAQTEPSPQTEAFIQTESTETTTAVTTDAWAQTEPVTTVSTEPPVFMDYTAEELRQFPGGKVLNRPLPTNLIDGCFTVSPMPDDIFERMNGVSYQINDSITRSDLSYMRVLHYTPDGTIQIGEMVINKAIADEVCEIFRALFDAQYPIERMLLIDEYDGDDEASMADNNSSCFNYRTMPGSKTLSRHALGLAVDINPLYNPYLTRDAKGNRKVMPAEAKSYADRTADFPMKIDENDLCYQLFTEHGFTWGGSWEKTPDYQHFEKAIS